MIFISYAYIGGCIESDFVIRDFGNTIIELDGWESIKSWEDDITRQLCEKYKLSTCKVTILNFQVLNK